MPEPAPSVSATNTTDRPTIKHRSAALAALALLVATAVLFAVLLSGGLWRWLVALAVAGLAVMAAWTAVTRTKLMRWAAVAVVVGCVVVLVVLAITGDGHGLGLPIALVGLAASTALARFALEPCLRAAAVARHRSKHVGPAGRSVLIVNPRSGDGKAEAVGLVDYARAQGVECVVLQPGDDFAAIVENVLASGVDAVGMAGGDGSQALVASVARRYDVPMVCVPAGTRNHFALDLGLDRENVRGAVDAFAEAFERRIDLATVNGKVFVNNCSLGFYAKVVQSPEYRGAKARTTTTKLSELLGPGAPPLGLRFQGPDGQVHDRAQVVQVSNNTYRLTSLGGFGTRERLDEGVLGIAAVELRGAADVARLAALEASGRAAKFDRLHTWSTPEFVVEADDGDVEVAIDGEAVVLPSPVTFRSLPGAVRVRMPVHAPGASPAGLRPPSWRWTINALWRVGLAGRWPENTTAL